MSNLNEKEEATMENLLEKMDEILNSDELFRNIDIVGDLLKIVESKYDL